MDLKHWQKVVHENNKHHGFYTGRNAKSIDRKILLAITELSEAFEELRNGHKPTEVYNNPSYVLPKPEGFGIELADAVIRIMDICEFLGIDLEKMIELKHRYNVTRPYRHGRKF